jgi:glutamate racemase
MNESRPVFIADSCIGGLSVVKSLWTLQNPISTQEIMNAVSSEGT